MLAVENCNPKIINSSFYYQSGIISQEWKLASPPINQADASQLQFTNNISITTEPQLIIFTETYQERRPKQLAIVETVKRFIRALPNMRYRGLGVNPSTFCTVEENNIPVEAPSIVNYLFSSEILSSQPTPHLSGTKITYKLERNSQVQWFYLDIEDVQLRSEKDNQRHSAVSFKGSFPHELFDAPTPESILKVLPEWEIDLQAYDEIVHGSFINSINTSK
ncbi:hypothetical protein [Chamaesiphon polymorphus]|uniref:TIGR04255 family protein n=1 Tax=Chamaesiphon polymorphus CCALA 037 TaxID=2107692 RepID=A0A2T1G9E0_9CYAN|nr:hypothetical protein [Chamaesiphon polymorphus]PSB53861.1 hypothetical protein C7B77_19230 [Chamaesiphon polymorphus CCALA 037]